MLNLNTENSLSNDGSSPKNESRVITHFHFFISIYDYFFLWNTEGHIEECYSASFRDLRKTFAIFGK